MSFSILSLNDALPTVFLQNLALSGHLDEISNVSGAVRSYICHTGKRDAVSGRLRDSLFFFVYQTTRHGPQNGFRLCLVHRGFHISSDLKVDGAPEDDIDRLEHPIAQGHMEVVVLGEVSENPGEADVEN